MKSPTVTATATPKRLLRLVLGLGNVTRNTPCQQSSINSVSHQGLDNGISSVHECGIYRLNVQRTNSLCRPSPFVIESPTHESGDQKVDQNAFDHRQDYRPLLSC